MKVGLIPPRGLERYALRYVFHLALAQECTRSEYIVAYQNRLEHHFLVIDNGAYEGKMVDPFEVLGYAYALHANEIVLPDTLRQAETTCEQVSKWIRKMVYPSETLALFAVAQGRRLTDFRYCVDVFAKHKSIATIGIPKHMPVTLGQLHTRIDFANWIEQVYPNRFKLHFLGANEQWPREVAAATKYTSVRSIDTSLPFSYTAAGKRIDSGVKGIIRPRDYFRTNYGQLLSGRLLDHNVNTYMRWANAEAPIGGV